jgi:signal transduction histidine kinase
MWFGERKANVAEVLDGVVEDSRLACGPGVLISIATNLVSNAMKFIGDAPIRRVTISAKAVGNDVLLEVKDTGPGFAPDLREKVFQPHVRGASTESGFGLGLATVKRLVEAHGGGVGVEASQEGDACSGFAFPSWTEDAFYGSVVSGYLNRAPLVLASAGAVVAARR